MENPPLYPHSYFLRKLVHGYVTRTGRIVEPYYRRYWAVEFPVAPSSLDLSAFGHEHFPRGPRIPPAPAAPRRGKRSEWIPLPEFIEDLYEDLEFFQIEDPLQRMDPTTDVISTHDGLIWHVPILERSMKSINAAEAGLVRAWILLYNTNSDEYFVFARARSLLLRPESSRKSFDGIYAEAVALYNDVVAWATDAVDYIEVRRLLAWTFWKRPRRIRSHYEKAPHKAGYKFKKARRRK